jgi:hypothetical protein
MGGGLLAVCFWRLQSSLSIVAPSSTSLNLKLYMGYFLSSLAMGIMIFVRAPQYQDDIDLFMKVRDHFLKENGMAWTAGLDFPDGFEPSSTAGF